MSTTASVLPARGYGLPAPRASVVALRARAAPARQLRPLRLDRGSVVRIEDGAGTLVHVRRGLVWVTEEESRKDVFLMRRQVHRLSQRGIAIVYADRSSRIVLEFARGVPRSVEIAPAAGESGRVVPLPTRGSLVDAVRSLGRALRTWWSAPRVDTLREHWPRRGRRWNEDDFTPEAVRARILRSSPFPYY